jgi:hypothetical protein
MGSLRREISPKRLPGVGQNENPLFSVLCQLPPAAELLPHSLPAGMCHKRP